jgi:hypothetical protein
MVSLRISSGDWLMGYAGCSCLLTSDIDHLATVRSRLLDELTGRREHITARMRAAPAQCASRGRRWPFIEHGWSQLSCVAKEAKTALGVENLDAIADRGYFNSEEILACEQAGITVTLPKPMTSNSKAEGRFGKQDFRYVAEEDVYICPAGTPRPPLHE